MQSADMETKTVRKMKRLLLLVLFSATLQAGAQSACTLPGQTPESAIQVCGSVSLYASTPIFCGIKPIPPPCGDGFPYKDQNPNFFRMACYNSGTLGFTISPTNPIGDFNWQLFDITATNPVDIFTNPALLVACNWSSDFGETGASSLGTNLVVCSGLQPLFSKMPDIVQGRTYLLMVCNQTPVAEGFELNFSGGTAVITEPALPRMLQARPDCRGTEILVRMNKKINCGSVALDGSDFILSAGANITSAYTLGCDAVSGSDSVFIRLDRPIVNGSYTLSIQTGTDGNTITDICGSDIAVGESIALNVSALQPATVTGISKTGCAPQWIDIHFSRPISCASLAADGSDFVINGPQAVQVSVAASTFSGCRSGLTNLVRLNILSPWNTGGNYQLSIVSGSDGNTVTDECGIITPAGQAGSFTITNPISAQFSFVIPPSCNATTIQFSHNGNGGASSWQWDFGTTGSSTLQSPVYTFASTGKQTIRLITTNGQCIDTAVQDIIIRDMMKSQFMAPMVVCPGDTVHLENQSTGNADQWRWEFGNGQFSTDKDPAVYRYAPLGREQLYTVSLIGSNTQLGCSDTSKRVIRVLANCYIAVPTAFSPNADGKNDYLYPLNALKADQLEFRVYNRMGQIIFSGRDWTQKWDGRVNGQEQATGVYAWTLTYIDKETKQRVFQKGTSLLIR